VVGEVVAASILVNGFAIRLSSNDMWLDKLMWRLLLEHQAELTIKSVCL
jgi:hypothetical protein